MGWSGVMPPHVTVAESQSAMTTDDWAGRGYALGQLGRDEDSYEQQLLLDQLGIILPERLSFDSECSVDSATA